MFVTKLAAQHEHEFRLDLGLLWSANGVEPQSWYAVENERLSWELEQLRGMVDMDELTRLRSDIDSLRQEMLHMASRLESLQVLVLQDWHANLALASSYSNAQLTVIMESTWREPHWTSVFMQQWQTWSSDMSVEDHMKAPDPDLANLPRVAAPQLANVHLLRDC